ncbi:phospholipid carrier-dependent glycosyltransferase [Ktedonosporobacter rubrisoli]|uniref:Phospholipid carrier-dependent glycosyltransferase n=1 Tax=Ktedonosporobacter rubrisoli TaxID=2509675 RepID=A0A4P6JXL6_KTERU|nr:glycosyltransferase family 39 protein [Ktedonosporobacter rubrisoli]QBD79766.1 phospholipid carrier-dependent glycosyltransferase [Ktedonosporobacter rubrisoli]
MTAQNPPSGEERQEQESARQLRGQVPPGLKKGRVERMATPPSTTQGPPGRGLPQPPVPAEQGPAGYPPGAAPPGRQGTRNPASWPGIEQQQGVQQGRNPISWPGIEQQQTRNPASWPGIEQQQTRNPASWPGIEQQQQTRNPASWPGIEQQQTRNPASWPGIEQQQTRNPISWSGIEQQQGMQQAKNPASWPGIEQQPDMQQRSQIPSWPAQPATGDSHADQQRSLPGQVQADEALLHKRGFPVPHRPGQNDDPLSGRNLPQAQPPMPGAKAPADQQTQIMASPAVSNEPHMRPPAIPHTPQPPAMGAQHMLTQQETVRPWPVQHGNQAEAIQQPRGIRPQPGRKHGLFEPEIDENGNMILYRSPNFFVRTVYRPGLRRNPISKPTGNTTAMHRVVPGQQERLAQSETRMMPHVELNRTAWKSKIPVPAWLETLVVILGLLASLLAHGLNMFNAPRYEIDEGTYMASAWAILNGQIANYPYGYGHPPLAWMQLAGLVQLVGGFFTFGNALNTGRVLMLVYAVGSTLLIYLLVRRLGGSRAAALLAMILFALSPLSVDYQRLVLLDNIGTFWMLLSLYLIFVSESRLSYITLGGISFGLALLSKEVFVMFLPGMIYAVWLQTTRFQRKFALVAFAYTICALGSSFVLMAVLKGELFPDSWHILGDNHQHLSLIGTFAGQAQRGGSSSGNIYSSWKNWVDTDNLLMWGSVVAIAFNALAGWWHRKLWVFAGLAICFWVLLLRGLVSGSGVVFTFYLIPLIPISAINMVLAIHTLLSLLLKLRLPRMDIVRALLTLGVIAVIIPYDVMQSANIFTMHTTSAQTEAMVWIRDHIPRNDFVVIPPYLYMDLRVPGGAGVGNGAPYPYAHVYFNVAGDPEIYDKILHNDADRIDYFISDSGMQDFLNSPSSGDDHLNLLKQAFANSVVVKQFSAPDEGTTLVIKIYQVRHKPKHMASAPSPGTDPPQLAQRSTMLVARRLHMQ